MVPAAAICAISLGACGGSAKQAESASSGSGPEFSDCMRAHGVGGFPDPLPGGGFSIPNDINISSPAFQAANKACGDRAPVAIAPPKPSEQQKVLAVKQSVCMRADGVSRFPDPTQNVPDPPSGTDAVLQRGMLWVIQASEISSPTFKSAAQRCGLIPRGFDGRLRGLIPGG